MQVSFYDNLGNSYNLKLSLKSNTATEDNAEENPKGTYTIGITDIVDSKGKSIFWETKIDEETKQETKQLTGIMESFTFGGVTFTPALDEESGDFTINADASCLMSFNTATGAFISVTGADAADTEGTNTNALTLSLAGGGEGDNEASTLPFEDLEIDFSTITQYASSGKCSLESQRGNVDGSGEGAGRTMGEMTGLSIDASGKI